MTNVNIKSLEKKLALKAGFLIGQEAFSLRVRENSDKSSWDYKKLIIQLGIRGIEVTDLAGLSDLLMKHEAGHVLYTDRDIDPKSLSFPFSILNILEDARVEPKMRADFSPLHSFSYKTHYLAQEKDEKAFQSPFNIGILLRWRRWGVETKTVKPDELTEVQYREFLDDWDKALEAGIEAAVTQKVAEYARALYEKWQFLFGRYKSDDAPAGSIEATADDLLGDGGGARDDGEGADTGEDDSPHSDDTAGIEELAEHFGGEWFQWDVHYIQSQAEKLRKLLQAQSYTDHEFALSGRRFDPRRIENPPLCPFRKLLGISERFSLDKLLVVIDGSGSMDSEPFRNACHLAYIFSLVFPAHIRITTNKSKNPISLPLSHIDKLKSFTSWGDWENYQSVGTDVSGYSFTLFLTDAQVCEDDKNYVHNTLAKLTKLGAGYVGRGSQRLEDVFQRNFFTDDLHEDLARMVALFLRRYFTRQVVA